MNGEAGMWSAVISQAIVDADIWLKGGCGNGNATPSQNEGAEAWKFLTDTSGPWARSRMDIAHVSGVCPDALRDRVLAARERDGTLNGLRERPAMAARFTREAA